MKKALVILIFFKCFAIWADEIGVPTPAKVTFANIPRIETIYGMEYLYDSVRIRVESNGCTSKESFGIQKYENSQDDRVSLLFIRNRPDWCKGYFPEGQTLEFSFEELGINRDDEFRVANPFGPNYKVRGFYHINE